ncbi:MAG: MerR family transcriptional regulator [Aquihabitans sp.]
MDTKPPEQPLRIGDVATASGLTVRALHHYEEVGLLRPSQRSPAGHRLYGRAAVERLYRISRLRRLGLSLDQIGHVLDDPAWELGEFLASHASALDAELERVTAVQRTVLAALANIEGQLDPTRDLLELLAAMEHSDHGLRRRISILVYADLDAAYEFLVNSFGLTPGEVTADPSGDTVHAEVYAGDGVIWLHPETAEYRLASPKTHGTSTSMMAVMVDDVDEHYRLVKAKGVEIAYEPIDQPYGYREYGARDCDGRLWSFMRELDQ